MNEFVVIFVTVGSSIEGEKIAAALVQEGLAACVNRIGSMHSVYKWEGKLCKESEDLLIIKSRKELFGAVEQRVREIHSYKVPEIIALPLVEGSASYLDWMGKNTRNKEDLRR